MNIFVIVSFLLSIAVLLAGLKLSTPDIGMFLDYPSIFIVVGGSFAATATSFRLNRIFTLIKVFLGRLLFQSSVNNAAIVKEVIQVIDQMKKGKRAGELVETVKDPFLRESLELIQDGMLEKQELLDVLDLRNKKLTAGYKVDCDKMRSMSKFPPAFGMIGTTIGMIVLLANLGGEDAMKMMGPAMGVCLITTLYGSAIANIILIPMAENLLENTKEIYAKNEIIIEGARLILDNANPILAAERLNSFLSPSDRVEWRELIQAA